MSQFICNHCFIDYGDKQSFIEHTRKVVERKEKRAVKPTAKSQTDNTTPLNEEDRLGEIKQIVSDSLHQIRTRALRDAPVYLQHVSSAESSLKQELTKLIQTIEKKAREEAINYFYWRIDCNTLISELEGWRGCIDNAKDQTERHFAQLEKGTE